MTMHQLAAVVALTGGLAAWTAEVPRKASELGIHLSDGKDLSLTQYRGKVIALAFIHTTCPHCQHLIGILNAVQQEYASRSVQVLASAFNDNAQVLLPEFQRQFRPNFPVGWDSRADTMTFLQISILNPGYVPKMVFIDRAGTIRAQYGGEEGYFAEPEKNIRATLEGLLKTAVVRKKK